MKSTQFTFILILFFQIGFSGHNQLFAQNNYKLVWSDEFEQEGRPDSTKWSYNIGNGCPELCGWGNNELQYYTDEASNVHVKNGKLHIIAREETKNNHSYTSGKLESKGKYSWKYGKLDVRAKLPKGQGIWPAIWMLGEDISHVGWPKCGEIDVVELIGGDEKDHEVHGTIHWDHNGSHASYGQPYKLENGIFNDDFHVFSIVWDERKIQWFVDGKQYNVVDTSPGELSEFQTNFYMILNLAVGGNWPGSPDSTTSFPQKMEVDYVRVYQKEK